MKKRILLPVLFVLLCALAIGLLQGGFYYYKTNVLEPFAQGEYQIDFSDLSEAKASLAAIGVDVSIAAVPDEGASFTLQRDCKYYSYNQRHTLAAGYGNQHGFLQHRRRCRNRHQNSLRYRGRADAPACHSLR